MGRGVSLVMLPVQKPSLSTSLTVVKCVCEGFLIVSAAAGCFYCTLQVGKCVCMGGGKGLRLCCLWIGFSM